ncbi:hypothetical protein [Leifsonia shinshuensis]|uniref:Capsular polysaccharide biosynthesis protein n=1 Tax=Leifsonia shinshuensis TaxID=150026 RepID=A0A7G6YDX9_9MICO|nr:hypothetical protein [Leifsonia shinshuensis]QNE36694.1 hypothetical protein F1C12_17295 [Leifsonia shinshuensis]
MTIREVLSAMGRRWYALLGVLVVAVLLVGFFARDGGGYTTKTVVTFLLPSATSLSPTNGASDTSIITFARAVAAEVNNGSAATEYSSDDSPYYGAGIRQGVLLNVPNDGNQWYASYTRAEIDVQIVGRTREWVQQQQTIAVAEILASSQHLQEALGAKPGGYISVTVSPLTLAITRVSPTRSDQVEAIAAMLLAVVIVSAWSSVALDRRLRRRSVPVRVPRFQRAKMGGSPT